MPLHLKLVVDFEVVHQIGADALESTDCGNACVRRSAARRGERSAAVGAVIKMGAW